MRLLPPLPLGKHDCRLPCGDRSVAGLIEAMLQPAGVPTHRLLAQQTAADPPLALWACCHAGREGRFLGTPDSIADWLIERGWRAFAAVPPSPVPGHPGRPGPTAGSAPADDPAVQADRIAKDVACAHLASHIAKRCSDAVAADAYLAGLLHRAADWTTVEASAKDGEIPNVPSAFFAFSADAAQCAQRASDALSVEPTPQSLREPVAAARLAGEHARRLWIEPLPDAACRITEIASRLIRLEALEIRFDDALERAKLDAMAEFAAGAGHEINNPLAVIAGRAQLFLRIEKDPERRHELATINTQVKRAHEMIADMRLFARPPRPQCRPIDLAPLLTGLAAEWGAAATLRAVSLCWEPPSSPVTVDADPEQLGVAVGALLRNALESVGHDGRIELTLRDEPDGAVISVVDNGRGITPEQRPHIFEPFYSARQAGRGLGLGLSKCWRIVENHGGRVTVESRPDHATVFCLHLRKHPSP